MWSNIIVTIILVGNVGDMLVHVAMMPALLEKIGRHQMSPMSWLDLWLGHISADISVHNCPAISMTCGAVTPMDIMGIFLRKLWYIFISIYAYNIIFVTFLQKIAPLQCNFLRCFGLFSLWPKESVNMSENSWMRSCWHIERTIWPTYFDDMSARHLWTYCQHADMYW